MDPLHLHRLYRLLLAGSLMLAACEPITVDVLPGGGISVRDPEAPSGPADGDGTDAGTSAPPPEDAGTDAGPGTEPDAGTGDGGTARWSPCVDGWQRRVVLPHGGKGDERFGLDSNSDAFFTEYTDGRLKVASSVEGMPTLDTGWTGVMYQSRVLVDGNGALHLAISLPESSSSDVPPPVYYLSDASGAWTRTEVARGLILDASLDPQGFVHLLVRADSNYRLLHVHNSSGAWEAENTGVETSAQTMSGALRIDASGHVHIAYPRRSTNNPGNQGTWYLTNASGTWVPERVSMNYGATALALGPTGVPHVFWASGGVKVGIRKQGGGWDVSFAADSGGGVPAVAVDAQGSMHVLTVDSLGTSVVYTGPGPARTWNPVRFITLEGPGRAAVGGVALEVDAQGRVHAMYMVFDLSGPTSKARIDYVRYCQ